MKNMKELAREGIIDISENYGLRLNYIAEQLGVHRVPLTQFKAGKDIFSEVSSKKIYDWCKNYKKAMEYFQKLQSKDEE